MTETGSGIWYGDRALDGVEVAVRDGEIFVRGPMLLRAYRHAAHDHDPKDGDRWFATGDEGTLIDGHLVVLGRRGSMIVSGGEKVWPEAVERVLAEHPAVAEVLVFGAPDASFGQCVTARVVVASGAPRPDLAELRAFARDRLAPYQLPRALEYAARLDRTALGKLRR